MSDLREVGMRTGMYGHETFEKTGGLRKEFADTNVLLYVYKEKKHCQCRTKPTTTGR